MLNSDEDEDVIFQGSAIDQHLQSTGYADYESTQIASCHQEKNCPSEGGKQKVEWPFVRNRILDVVKSLFWPLELRQHFYKRIVRNAYESKLLIPDDLLQLKHFIPHDFHPSNQSGDYFWIIEAIFWCYRGLLLCAFLCFCLVLFFLKVSANWSLLFLMFIVTSAIWILSVSWDLYKSTCEVYKFLCVLQNSGHLVSKVLRFLLEEDLISRGFVLAQGTSSFASRGRTEPPYCEGLRHTLHDTLYFMLPVLHHAHNHLKMAISYYPCIRGLFDDFEEINAELRENVTEHLKFLKKLVTLIKLQTSSVITQVILCASDVKAFENLDENFFSFCSLNQIEKASALLLKHFTYAESFWLKDEERQEFSCEEKKNNVYLAIHSLSLHLQAALCKIQDLEKKFERLETNSDKDINLEDSLSYESVKEHINLIQNELNSCQGCLDETSARVDRKYSVKEEEMEKSDLDLGSNIEDITAAAGTRKLPIPLFDLEEPIIQDEVFEAYVDKDHDNHDKESSEDFWNTTAREERKKLKQQKQRGKRVINELQPLLNKLREVWEERETAALLRQKMGHQVQPSVAPLQTKRNSGERGNLDIAVNEMGNEVSVQKLSDVESQGSKEADLSLKKTSCSSNLPSLECHDYDDSDDERLALYRKVREELERDEKSHVTYPLVDSDDERLEVYRKFRNELDANEKLHQPIKVQEGNSDDERLKAYRKNRNDLEMEEKSYSADSEDESDSEKSNFKRKVEKRRDEKGKTSLFPKGLKNSTSKQAYGNSSLHSIADRDMVLQNVSEGENLLDDSMQQSIDILDIQKVLDISKRGNSRNYNDSLKISSDKTNVKSIELSTENTASDTDLRFANNSDPSETLEEETFVHGDDTDSEDDSPHIDWGTVTFPSRITDTLEDRMQLFSGNSLGFHAGLAAEAVEASQKFLSKKNVETETFLGVGEGEEVFGDESETE